MPNPTSWNPNPTASTADVVNYDSPTQPYDKDSQPYDGYAAGERPYNWKNPTAYTNSLISPAQQQYYGGPSYVPLYGGPTQWKANPNIVNQAGQYVPGNSAYADLWPYDGTGVGTATRYNNPLVTYDDPLITYSGITSDSQLIYDSDDRNYDGVHDDMSFANWKIPAKWTPISGGNDF